MTIFIRSSAKPEDANTANDQSLRGPHLQILSWPSSGGSQGLESPRAPSCDESLLTWKGEMPTEPVQSSQCAPWAGEAPAHLGKGEEKKIPEGAGLLHPANMGEASGLC